MKRILAPVAEVSDAVRGVSCGRAPKVLEAAGHAWPAPDLHTPMPHEHGWTAAPSTPSARVVSGWPGPTLPVGTPMPDRKAIWDKDNVAFWLPACLVLSLLFSILYRALG